MVWQSVGAGIDGVAWPPRSSFTWRDAPLPFVVWDPRAWPPAGDGPPAFRSMHERSLQTFASDAEAASIPVERAAADVILVAGASDALYPSDTAAHALAERLDREGKHAVVLEHPHAGHSPFFPGEARPTPHSDRAWGGEPAADRELGDAAWTVITQRLGLQR